MKWSPGRGRGRRAALLRVDGLVALRIRERLRDVGRKRRFAVGLTREAKAPAALAERLQELDGAELHALAKPPARPGQRLPHIALDPFEQQDFGAAAGRPLEHEAGRKDARVVHDDERRGRDERPEVAESPVLDRPVRAVEDEQPRLVPALQRTLRDELRGELVVKLRRPHADIRIEG